MNRAVQQVLILFLLMVLLNVGVVSAVTYPLTEAIGATYTSVGDGTPNCMGMIFTTNTSNLILTNVTLYPQGGGGQAQRVLLWNGSKSLLANVSTSGNGAIVNYTLPYVGKYYICADHQGGSWYSQENPPTLPRNRTVLTYNGSFYGLASNPAGWTEDVRARDFVNLIFDTNATSGANTITVSLRNLVNDSSWPEEVTFGNVTGTLTFSYFNITGTGYCVTYTGNGTGTNCTAGNGVSTYFNVSNTSLSVTGSITVSAGTYQGTINLQAYQLFTNASIGVFNATNNKVSNTTSTGSLTILSTVGTQNVLVLVGGNYSKNVSCTLSTALSSASCNATGIYDDLFTIGVTNASNGAGVGSFSASMVNSTLGASASASTTTGNVTFQTVQGYNYVFSVNATALELLNATLRANASTNLYNFSLRTANTFNFTVYNESTNSLIIQNVTLQIVSGDFAQNYTFTGGNITIPLLTPGEYTITYWVDPDVPRNYFYVLTSQSYNHVKLYIIDEAISNLYLPIIINGNTVPVANVTVQLLRDYIISGSTHAYSIVEMARTDTNGQAVLRVVPNIVDYKLIITDGSNTLATTPTKFTANTNTYTFSTEGNPTTSLVGYENIAKSLTFDNSTLTYTFTWSDTQNIVSSGCLKVTKFKNGVQTTPLNGCVAGSTGSITHTINDTNGTSYVATATMLTSTTFSTLSAGSLSADFVTTFASFGLVGFLIVFIIFLTFVFVGGESGIAGALVSGFLAILIAGAFGFIASSWTAVIVPAAIIIGIIIYKLRG